MKRKKFWISIPLRCLMIIALLWCSTSTSLDALYEVFCARLLYSCGISLSIVISYSRTFIREKNAQQQCSSTWANAFAYFYVDERSKGLPSRLRISHTQCKSFAACFGLGPLFVYIPVPFPFSLIDEARSLLTVMTYRQIDELTRSWTKSKVPESTAALSQSQTIQKQIDLLAKGKNVFGGLLSIATNGIPSSNIGHSTRSKHTRLTLSFLNFPENCMHKKKICLIFFVLRICLCFNKINRSFFQFFFYFHPSWIVKEVPDAILISINYHDCHEN